MRNSRCGKCFPPQKPRATITVPSYSIFVEQTENKEIDSIEDCSFMPRPPIILPEYILVIVFGFVVTGFSYFGVGLRVLEYVTEQPAAASYPTSTKASCFSYLSVKRSGKTSTLSFSVDEQRALSGDYGVYVRKPSDLEAGGGTNYTVNALSSVGTLVAQYGFKDVPYVIAETFASDGTITGNAIELPESYSDLFVPYDPAIAKLVVLVGKKNLPLSGSGALPSCGLIGPLPPPEL